MNPKMHSPDWNSLMLKRKKQELLISKLEKQIQNDSTKESQLKDLESRKKGMAGICKGCYKINPK